MAPEAEGPGFHRFTPAPKPCDGLAIEAAGDSTGSHAFAPVPTLLTTPLLLASPGGTETVAGSTLPPHSPSSANGDLLSVIVGGQQTGPDLFDDAA